MPDALVPVIGDLNTDPPPQEKGTTFRDLGDLATMAIAERLPMLSAIIDGVPVVEAVSLTVEEKKAGKPPKGAAKHLKGVTTHQYDHSALHAVGLKVIARPPSLEQRLNAFRLLVDIAKAANPQPQTIVVPSPSQTFQQNYYDFSSLSVEEKKATLHALRQARVAGSVPPASDA